MSVDQRLISKQDHGFYTAPWVAATATSNSQGMLKEFQRIDVEAVNVAATCDKLCLAVRRSTGFVAPEAEIPFRIASNLCYGTLRIYQQQVNCLLAMSRDLLSRSTYDMPFITATKRKSTNSMPSIYSDGKRRRKENYSTLDTIMSNNFSEIMYESENIKERSQNEMTLFEKMPIKAIQRRPNEKNRVSVQIHEITIREINADIVLPEFGIDDDDSGFGNATTEELAELINIFADVRNTPKDRKSLKRSASIEPILYDKISKISADSKIESIRCANTSHSTPNFEMSYDSGLDSSLSRIGDLTLNHVSPNVSEVNNNDKEGLEDVKAVMNTNEQVNNEPVVNEQVIIEQALIKDIQSISKKRNSKLKLDKFKEYDVETMESFLENYPKLCCFTRQTCKKLPTKKYETAQKLLHRLNRNIPFKHNFKEKRKIIMPLDIVASSYLNILSDILHHDVSDELASDIWPHWNRDPSSVQLKNNRKQAQPVEPFLNINSFDELSQEIVNFNKDLHIEPMCTAEDNADHKEWGTYSVMMKLLDIWRCADSEDEIDAQRFCLSVNNRTNSALTFSSLMSLAAKGFIAISKKTDSIEMQTIKLGVASEQLLQNVQKLSKRKKR